MSLGIGGSSESIDSAIRTEDSTHLRQQLADLLRESLDVDCDEVWENERTPTTVRVFGVCLHSMGLSVREGVAVLDLLGVDRSHGAIWNWTHTLSEAQSDPPTSTRA